MRERWWRAGGAATRPTGQRSGRTRCQAGREADSAGPHQPTRFFIFFIISKKTAQRAHTHLLAHLLQRSRPVGRQVAVAQHRLHLLLERLLRHAGVHLRTWGGAGRAGRRGKWFQKQESCRLQIWGLARPSHPLAGGAGRRLAGVTSALPPSMAACRVWRPRRTLRPARRAVMGPGNHSAKRQQQRASRAIRATLRKRRQRRPGGATFQHFQHPPGTHPSASGPARRPAG